MLKIKGKIIDAQKVTFNALERESFSNGAITKDVVIIQTRETFKEKSIIDDSRIEEHHRYRFYVSENWGQDVHGRYVLLKDITRLPMEDANLVYKLYVKDVKDDDIYHKIFF